MSFVCFNDAWSTLAEFFSCVCFPSGAAIYVSFLSSGVPPDNEVELRFCFSLRDLLRAIQWTHLSWTSEIFSHRGRRHHIFAVGALLEQVKGTEIYFCIIRFVELTKSEGEKRNKR